MPRSLQVARSAAAARRASPRLVRPVDTTASERALRAALTAAFKKAQGSVRRRVTAETLNQIWKDASSRRTAEAKRLSQAHPLLRGIKEAIGRGGRPLGTDRARELNAVFELDEMKGFASLIEDDQTAFKLALSETLEEGYDELFEVGGNAARRALGVRGAFALDSPAIADALAARANQLAGNIAADVFERLKTVIADEFYLQGKGPGEVGKALADEFDWLTQERADLIARTETGAVTEEAQWLTYVVSGVPFKRWLTTLDGREREDHFEAHGQIAAIDEPFIVGGEELMHPLDPAGSAAQVCNCRCSEIPVVTADQALSDADVWDGSNDPDQFAKERAADPDLPPGLQPPPPSSVEDLDFMFPED